MDEETRIDVPQVLLIAQNAADVGTRIEQQAKDLRGWGAETASAVVGAQVCAALPDIATAYSHLLTSMGLQVETYGTEMHRAASDYWSADIEAQRSIGSAGQPAARATEAVARLVR